MFNWESAFLQAYQEISSRECGSIKYNTKFIMTDKEESNWTCDPKDSIKQQSIPLQWLQKRHSWIMKQILLITNISKKHNGRKYSRRKKHWQLNWLGLQIMTNNFKSVWGDLKLLNHIKSTNNKTYLANKWHGFDSFFVGVTWADIYHFFEGFLHSLWEKTFILKSIISSMDWKPKNTTNVKEFPIIVWEMWKCKLFTPVLICSSFKFSLIFVFLHVVYR